MKFSDETISILKNFATINPSVLMKPGKEIRTISPHKNILAIASIPDEIPAQACVYDLSRFLSIMSLYDSPEIEFDEKYFLIHEGKKKTKYVYADVSMIHVPPEKAKKEPSFDMEVDVKWADLQSVIKAASVLSLPEVAFVGEEGVCSLKAIDSENPSADTFGIELGETNDNFTLILKTENLKLLPKDYNVKLSSAGISSFVSDNVTYFIAISSDSKYQKGEE